MVLVGFAYRTMAGLRPMVNATTCSPMRKRKPTKAWVAYKFAKIGKRLATEWGKAHRVRPPSCALT